MDASDFILALVIAVIVVWLLSKSQTAQGAFTWWKTIELANG